MHRLLTANRKYRNVIYLKTTKSSDTQKIAVIILKLELYHFTTKRWVQKSHGMGKNVDPDQTAPLSDLGLNCLPYRPVSPKVSHYGCCNGHVCKDQ